MCSRQGYRRGTSGTQGFAGAITTDGDGQGWKPALVGLRTLDGPRVRPPPVAGPALACLGSVRGPRVRASSVPRSDVSFPLRGARTEGRRSGAWTQGGARDEGQR